MVIRNSHGEVMASLSEKILILSIIELHLDQACFSNGVIAIDALTVPSMNPSLLLASKAILIALDHIG